MKKNRIFASSSEQKANPFLFYLGGHVVPQIIRWNY